MQTVIRYARDKKKHLLDVLAFAIAFGLFYGLSVLNNYFKFYHPLQEVCKQLQTHEKIISIALKWIFIKLSHVIVFFRLINILENKPLFSSYFFTLMLFFVLFVADFILYTYWNFYIDIFFSVLYTLVIEIVILILKAFLKLSFRDYSILAINALILSLTVPLVQVLIGFVNLLFYESMEAVQNYGNTLLYFYLFPFIDFGIEFIIRQAMNKANSKLKKFLSQAYFLLFGFRVSVITRISFSEPEFYYLLFGICLREFLMKGVDSKLWPDCCFSQASTGSSLWIAVYALLLYQNYNPVPQFFSKSFMNYTCKLTYDWNTPYLIPSQKRISGDSHTKFALLMQGIVVWVVWSISRRYRGFKWSWQSVLYSLYGIYLFAEGLTAGRMLS